MRVRKGFDSLYSLLSTSETCLHREVFILLTRLGLDVTWHAEASGLNAPQLQNSMLERLLGLGIYGFSA